MSQHILLGGVSTSASLTESKRELTSSGIVLQVESIKNFIFLGATFTSANLNFDIFSGAAGDVPAFYFLVLEFIIGVPYMYMDLFIKQYTGRLDLNEHLNPFLKPVNYGALLNSMAWSIAHSIELSESAMYLITCFAPIPIWNECQKNMVEQLEPNATCLSGHALDKICDQSTQFSITSIHYYYRHSFGSLDRIILTRKMVLVGVTWLCIFFVCTLSEHILAKIFKLSVIIQVVTTLAISFYILISVTEKWSNAVQQVLRFPNSNNDIEDVLNHVVYVSGIGLAGVYDFGTMSPFTITGNAVILFQMYFIVMAIIRSMFTEMIILIGSDCIVLPPHNSYHYLLNTILPTYANFFRAQRLFVFYVFVYLIASLFTHTAAFIYTISKMLHSEFRGIKSVYISGILSFLGLGFCVIMLPLLVTVKDGFKRGLFKTMIIIGFLRTTIIMYLYGVRRFATDISFWLGYKPTAIWIVSWSLQPPILLFFVVKIGMEMFDSQFIQEMHELPNPMTPRPDLIWRIWVAISVLLVIFLTFRTIWKHVAANKLGDMLKASKKYGPPEAEERKKRRKFNEALNIRECPHDCFSLDDMFECNHGAMMYAKSIDILKSDISLSTMASEASMTRIFDASMWKARLSEMVDVQQLQN